VKKIAIMQPTYLPWLGYFGLMACVDEFVILDDVQFERKSWQQKNRIKGIAGFVTLKIPVCKTGKLNTAINEIEIDWSSEFDRKHLRAIESAYARAAYWRPYGERIREMISRRNKRLADYTVSIIEELRAMLGIGTPLLRSAALPAPGKRQHRLVTICQTRGAGRYVSPTGSKTYLADGDAFDKAGIELLYNEYEHPVYPQLHGDFVSHLSVIDLLLNCGPESLAILQAGVRLTASVAAHMSHRQ
jgi:hypothetical protein